MPPPMAKRATKTSTGMKIIRRIMIAHSFTFLCSNFCVDSSGMVLDASQCGFSFNCFGFVSGFRLLNLGGRACQHFPFALQEERGNDGEADKDERQQKGVANSE